MKTTHSRKARRESNLQSRIITEKFGTNPKYLSHWPILNQEQKQFNMQEK